MSVSSLAAQCDRFLFETQSNYTLNHHLRLDLVNLRTRFRIWAGNVGAFAPENASIDYRLRDDPDVASIFSSMLGALKTSIEHAVNPSPREEDERDDEHALPESASDSTSSSSSGLELELDSGAEEPFQPKPNAGHDDLIRRANDIINRLYRLASVVRKPVSTNENNRARQIIADKPEWICDELEDVEDHARSHMLAHFREASSALIDRLVLAVVFRRGKLCYRRRHQEKLRQLDQSLGNVHRAYKFFGKDRETHPRASPGPREAHGETSNVPGSSRGLGTGSKSIALSRTNASSINRQRLPGYAKSTALSVVTRAAVTRRQQLDVPRPPGREDGYQKNLECTYCFRIIRTEETEEPRWT